MDLVIRNARVAGVDQPVDIGVRGERIARIVPGSTRPRRGRDRGGGPAGDAGPRRAAPPPRRSPDRGRAALESERLLVRGDRDLGRAREESDRRGHHASGRHGAPLAPGPRRHAPPGPRRRLRSGAHGGAGAPSGAGGLARRDRHPARRVPPAGDPLVPGRREAHGRGARAGRRRRGRHPALRVDPGVRRARRQDRARAGRALRAARPTSTATRPTTTRAASWRCSPPRRSAWASRGG